MANRLIMEQSDTLTRCDDERKLKRYTTTMGSCGTCTSDVNSFGENTACRDQQHVKHRWWNTPFCCSISCESTTFVRSSRVSAVRRINRKANHRRLPSRSVAHKTQRNVLSAQLTEGDATERDFGSHVLSANPFTVLFISNGCCRPRALAVVMFSFASRSFRLRLTLATRATPFRSS